MLRVLVRFALNRGDFVYLFFILHLQVLALMKLKHGPADYVSKLTTSSEWARLDSCLYLT